MSNKEYCEKLYKRQEELVHICNYHNMYGYQSDDIIQDLYEIIMKLKNVNRYVSDGQPNMFIIFAIIKNLIYHYRKKEARYSSKELYDFEIIDEETETDGRCITFIVDEIENIDNWFDKNIIDLYVNKKMSIRKIAKETDIGFWFIQPVIHKFKNQVKMSYIKSN